MLSFRERNRLFWRFWYRVKDIKWWFLHRFSPWHRYHIVKIGKPGWSDSDHKMLHACFIIFCDFVEKEDGLENLDYQWKAFDEDDNWSGNLSAEEKAKFVAERKFHYEEAKYLYDWWKKVYPVKFKDEVYINNDLYDEETEHLVRLIRIRGVLWT